MGGGVIERGAGAVLGIHLQFESVGHVQGSTRHQCFMDDQFRHGFDGVQHFQVDVSVIRKPTVAGLSARLAVKRGLVQKQFHLVALGCSLDRNIVFQDGEHGFLLHVYCRTLEKQSAGKF